ncbi:hypothetical protein BC943DRAFT_315825 [Umbelopsis sp. AD052]|nr:hypothetical protein BC943DRAFT_315825 [Umbelopsis sp. AD052]
MFWLKLRHGHDLLTIYAKTLFLICQLANRSTAISTAVSMSTHYCSFFVTEPNHSPRATGFQLIRIQWSKLHH